LKVGGALWTDTIALLTPTPLRSHLTVSEKAGKNPRINFRGFFCARRGPIEQKNGANEQCAVMPMSNAI
jgi:hypothetical protein